MSSEEIRERFRKFFEAQGHKWVASSSLIPTDPSVLLTTAGMQQFKKYYTGEADPVKDFDSLNVASIQKAFRTSDIDEVGDETHLTFFEMLGNFSFDGYGKKEAIKYAYDFITKELSLKIDYVTVFEGDEQNTADFENTVLPDNESVEMWESLDVSVKQAGREDNFWGPTGSEGPCGPTTEIYVNGVEVWNLVFNEYYCYPGGRLSLLRTPGVDTGMGLERLLSVLNNTSDIFATDVLKPIVDKIISLDEEKKLDKRALRILADHLRASIFLIADGVRPSNKEAGYILRRLLRRIIAYQIKYDFHPDLFVEVLPVVVQKFGAIYSNLKNESEILSVWRGERGKFEIALGRGIKELRTFKKITAQDAFKLYQSYGLPFEIIKEVAAKESVADLSEKDFEGELIKHQEISRAGAEKKFGGHGLLLDTGELKARDEAELQKVTRLHTATHLLQAALRQVLGDRIHQKGSDITSERTRFDFSFDRKVTDEELKRVETLVNEVVQRDLPVRFEEMPFDETVKKGALYSPEKKYPSKVKLYYAGHSLEEAFSKELCGGPHVTQTGEVGKFKILKEEGAASGVRRIRAHVI